MSIPISTGSGAASVAAEAVGGLQYQQIEVLGPGGASVLSVNPDHSINVSVIGGIQIGGSVLAVGNHSVSGAINVSGSVLLGSSNASVITYLQSSSIIAINAGSVVGIIPGSVITLWQSPSIVGTYVEDSAHTSGDKGLLSLNVRNDTLASVTSADGDYGALALGPAGEGVTVNAPFTKWVQGTADLRVVLGSSVTAIAAQGASVFTYITGVQVANFGSASVLVTLAGGLGSILGYTIAPAGGGSNIIYTNALKTGANSAFTASINGTASVLVSAQGFIAKI